VSVRILTGDVREQLKTLADDSVDCVVTSPPYWGLRDYGVDGQLGMERTLGEHIETMVEVFRDVRRVLKPSATLWLNYGDCYATHPNGKSAAAYKADGSDDRTFRDKPFSTVGAIYGSDPRGKDRRGNHSTLRGAPPPDTPGRIAAGGYLKPKDLCMIPNRLAIALQDDGWWVRSEIIWSKPNPMPESVTDRPAGTHEKVWLLTKSARYHFDAEAIMEDCSPSTHARLSQDVANQIGSERANGGRKTNGNMKAVVRAKDADDSARPPGSRPHSLSKFESRKIAEAASGIKNNSSMDGALAIMPLKRNARNVWEIPTAAFSEAHFATFPPALVERCLLAGCPKGGTVLDPFFGAGTTGLVADRLGHDCIGIELNSAYVAIARARIHGDCPMFTEVA